MALPVGSLGHGEEADGIGAPGHWTENPAEKWLTHTSHRDRHGQQTSPAIGETQMESAVRSLHSHRG